MKADVQGVGESVLLDLEGYQFLMARDDASLLGSALLRVVASGGDVLDDPPTPQNSNDAQEGT